MKKLLLGITILTLFLIACASKPKAVEPDELDLAILEASDYLNANIPRGNKLAIIAVRSDYPPLSEYIIDTLTENIVNDRLFTVVERQQLEAIRAELNFNLSGEVDDNSAQAIGRMLGAQTIVLGSVNPLGNSWRMSVRALTVEKAEVQGLFNRNIPNGSTIAALTSGPKVASSPQGTRSPQESTASGGTAQTGQAAQAPQAPARPKNGTYTFYPRIRAFVGAAQAEAYISHIVVRGDFMNIYITGAAQGSYVHPGHYMISIAANARNVILQDLDNPARSYNPEGPSSGWDYNNENRWYVFRGVTARRFSLTFDYNTPPVVWEEIILGEPD